ncbi:hypothetical protein [Amycolatopsis thermophila]|uniref:Uncharacterized protein n=1 Tax=Amycolatopsis thermophila TaxID=206084 RepID=A0ABU0ERP7_9PSEU|nr:hypothetical protein [Amycolatopsis thermophila]MDQ0377973.1 hypothetical protein [Amycolatopsis thermophila]
MTSSLTPAQRTLRAQVAAHTSWAKTTDRAARTAPARRAALARFEKQVDPEGRMTPRQRADAAESARKAFFLALAAKSAAARRQR